MWVYILRRFLAIIPTLIGITLISFVVINLAPGGPIEQKLMQMRYGAGGEGGFGHSTQQAVSQEVIDQLKKQYGFDKPVAVRYWIWLKNLSHLDFGKSMSFEEPVTEVIAARMPVSIQFGLVSFILGYLFCVPLGIAKAVWRGTKFDTGTSMLLFMAHATPSFMLAILLIVFLGGGSFLNWFPITGAVSDHYSELSFWAKVWDRIHHAILPLICYTIGHLATMTVLMKNSVLEEIRKVYVRTARAKGLGEKVVILRHAVRNALIPVATGFGHILSVFFAGSLLIESIFGLGGMGWLSFQSIVARDYNVVMGLLVIESFMFLFWNILSDLLYLAIDPRIDFT